MRDLGDLKLPRLVEAQKRRSTSSDFEVDPDSRRAIRISQVSVSSDYSPITPTFSLTGHSRFPSSSSSLAGSPSLRTSIDGFGAKRPLTQVNEEPHERDCDFEMLNSSIHESTELDQFTSRSQEFTRLDERDLDVQADYDWIDASYSDEHFELSVSKRRRADDSPTPDNPTSSMRIPGSIRNLSQKWKSRKEKRFSSIGAESFHESLASRSRASSMRSPSIKDRRESLDYADNKLPVALSPADSFIEDGPIMQAPRTPEQEPVDDEFDEEASKEASRTPLLPPVLTSLMRETAAIHSPLQSPKVAGSPSLGQKDALDSPSAWNGLPSPPLSTKPSTSSFHHRPIVPPSEIPPITLAEPQDKWALKLGHANFYIYPEPYLPPLPATIESCKQLREDWDMARSNYVKHLSRTREHYSTTSKVHQLTEQKWAEVDATWKQYHETVVASAGADSQEALELSYHSLKHPTPETAIRLPSIRAPQNEGKFPKVGDIGIVGPMQVLKPVQQQQRPAKKRAFWKFIQGMLPTSVAFGRSN